MSLDKRLYVDYVKGFDFMAVSALSLSFLTQAKIIIDMLGGQYTSSVAWDFLFFSMLSTILFLIAARVLDLLSRIEFNLRSTQINSGDN